MFYHIEGKISEITKDAAIIDCNGVGYEVKTSLTTMSSLKTGEKAKLFVAEHIREDTFDLYGFFEKREKNLFDMLRGVSGVGPKAAISILSIANPEALAMAIMSGDSATLTRAPGIGKKIAQRLILELKDKIAKDSIDLDEALVSEIMHDTGSGNQKDAVSALSVLGYTSGEINSALKGVNTREMNTEEIIKTALKNMMK
ncbi:MAG: Holliday junction branch migration protein RuvA [Ruminococcaceae bacterium]|nr:Holliday junction branch migration protein RuvA [Oscillospiraceae bacterium]